jgi:galactonate dehydratase
MIFYQQELPTALDCVEAVADAVGDRADFLIEAHGRFNVPTAIRIGRALERFDVLWLEEPIPPDSQGGLAEVRRSIRVPVAAGERLYSRWEY